MTQTENLKFALCPGSMPLSAYEATHMKIYACWQSVWAQTFDELSVKKPLYSDAFSRQDLVGALLWKNSCLALSFFRWADAGRPEFAADSYFSNWSKEDLKSLCSRGNKIIICSNFTVHPMARGKNLGVSFKELLTGMSIETFLNSDADGMTGALRVDRGVSSACERWGGYVIQRGVPCDFGANNTDLLGFFKDHIMKQPAHELKTLVQELWKNRLVIPRQDLAHQFLVPSELGVPRAS